jgi:hypothetical protein
LNYIIFQNSKLPINMADVLIAGDSHPQMAIDPSRMISAINIAKTAEPYVLTYWKLKYIFKHHKPKILILGFAHHNISAFNDMKFWNKKWSHEMFRRSYIINEFNSIDDMRLDRMEFYKVFIKEMCLYPHNDHFKFIGGYSNSNRSDLSDIKSAIIRHYYYKNTELNISETEITYLNRIVSLCKKHGINLILVGTPVTEKYLELIPDIFKRRYDIEKIRLLSENSIVADFTCTFYEDNLYLDADHLNEKGASKFTHQINSLLEVFRAQQGAALDGNSAALHCRR